MYVLVLDLLCASDACHWHGLHIILSVGFVKLWTAHKPMRTFKASLGDSKQCDQIKIAKCLLKLPKNDFTRKMNYFDTFTKIAYECRKFGQINCC